MGGHRAKILETTWSWLNVRLADTKGEGEEEQTLGQLQRGREDSRDSCSLVTQALPR